ncbi:MAG: hypothetical protein R3F61_08760 [Myxococcota bacterium]
MRILWTTLVLAACAVGDSDLDGLDDAEEKALGTDPANPDTDGDGLVDGAEVARSTDPLAPDTDGDGYTDRDEVHEGTDPLDPESRIYTGGWPYVFDKSGIPSDSGSFLAVGATFVRMQLVDAHGEIVDLYDFYNADRPVVIDVSAEWCPPCQDLSAWIAGNDPESGYGSVWGAGPQRIADGEVYWLTLMAEDVQGRPPDPELAERWESAFPSDDTVVVLSDEPQLSKDYAGVVSWPSLFLLEPDLTLSASIPNPEDGSVVPVLEELRRRTRGN